MPIPTSINDLSTTANSNSPAGTDSPVDGDNFLRAHASFIATLRNKLSGVVNLVGDYGADPTGVLSSVAAIEAAAASGYAEIVVPEGVYLIDDDVDITLPVTFIGKGSKNTVFRQTGAAKNGVNFNFPSLTQGGGLVGISIEAGTGWITAGNQGTGSTGVALKITLSNGKFICDDVGLHNFAHGLQLLGCYHVTFRSSEVLYFQERGIYVAKSGSTTGAGNLIADSKVSNFGFSGTNTNSLGLLIAGSGGEIIRHTDFTSANKNIQIKPPAGSQVLYCDFDTVRGDTAATTNWEIDGTDGLVWSTRVSNGWAAYSTAGPGVDILGTNVNGLAWDGGSIRENGTNGVRLRVGTNVRFSDVEVSSNSKASANVSAGVLIDANVSGWAFEGSRIGNFASSITGHAENISIAAGTSSGFRIIGCDLSNPGAGKSPLANGSSSLSWTISGNYPKQNLGLNASDRFNFAGGSLTTVAAGATTYLTHLGQGSLGAAPYIVDKPGAVARIRVNVPTAPGVGQTFTYTLMVNGVATSMNFAISGTDTEATYTLNNSLLSILDELELRLVASAGAAVTTHSFSVSIEP